MANDYRLDADEVVLLRELNVFRGEKMTFCSNDLILTNKNIICVTKTPLGKVKNVDYFPLEQLKVYHGIPQAVKSRPFNGAVYCLYLYFVNSEEHFRFANTISNNKTIDTWIAEIQRLFGCTVMEDTKKQKSNEGIFNGAFNEVRNSLKDAGKELASAFGFNLSKDAPQPAASCSVNTDNADNAAKGNNTPPKKASFSVICPHCHAEVAEGLTFCTNCGERLGKQPKDDEPAVNVCRQCGNKFPLGFKFCTECGTPVGEVQDDEKETIPEKSAEPPTSENEKEELTLDQKMEILEKLKSLADLGILTQEEYEQKKKETLL